jgi:predicted DNA-binding transcriptional regulator YafY
MGRATRTRSKLAHRSITMLLLLCQNRWWTIKQLSDRFEEIGIKTVRRDLAAIEASGVPIIEERQIESYCGRGIPPNQYRVMSDWGKKFLEFAGLKWENINE